MGVATAGTVPSTTSNFELKAGTFTFNAGGSGGGFVAGGGTVTNRTTTFSISSGTLEMNGKPINAVGNSTLALSGGVIDMGGGNIGNLSSINFTGGTLRNLGILERGVTQSADAPSLLSVQTHDAVIAGTYHLMGGTVNIAAGRNLTVPAGLLLDGGTLMGDGIVIGNIIAVAGAVHPGSSPGTLTVDGDLTLGSEIILNFELGTNADSIVVGGALTLNGVLNVTDAGGLGYGTYTLLTYGAGLIDNTLEIGILPDGFEANIDTTVAGQVNLVITAVPEPSTLLLAMLAAIGLTIFRRKRSGLTTLSVI